MLDGQEILVTHEAYDCVYFVSVDYDLITVCTTKFRNFRSETLADRELQAYLGVHLPCCGNHDVMVP